MSKIQWTERTWNPIIGCSKISEGCANCYAEKMAARLSNIPTTPMYKQVVENGQWNGKTALVESALEIPLKRKKPTTYFVGSMTDLFHESTPFEWIDKVFAIMALCPQHKFILLTKRPDAMWKYMHYEIDLEKFNFNFPLPNIILGITAENQEQADKRIPILLNTPAAARFVSIEPMLGAVDLKHITIYNGARYHEDQLEALTGRMYAGSIMHTQLPALDWVICGGESGPNARPMHPDWARSLRDQCKEAGVPFFFKQWGEFVAVSQMTDETFLDWDVEHGGGAWGSEDNPRWKFGKKATGNLLDGVVWEQRPWILEGGDV